ncbi:bleomycin resistance protein [Echinicola pacifica]|uniref:Bleomycin resistance protein n=1 Tax=Echinicola pacifica TaxID=346377 RepID=A0A918Q4M0_9BACT|nr:VOC family protein [Echinicola pacifica]GGZ31879.1 bleomycin resistance protein [Echinicola pacifica]
MNYSQIKETCIYLTDLDQAEAFYNGLLDMPIISREDDRHIFFRCGSSVLLCFIPEVTKNEENLPPHFAYGKQHIALEVPAEEYDAAKKELLAKGIKITHTQDWKEGLESIYFDDPFGNVLEIVPKGIWE